MLAVLVTGPPGAGKSTVATAVHDRLGDAGIANALVEVDELERCYPPLNQTRMLANLTNVCATYRAAGYELLFVTATIEDDDYGDRLLTAMGAETHLLVRVEAEPATLERRVRAREPVGWSGLDSLLESSARLAVEMPSLRGVDLVLNTDNHESHVLATWIDAAIRKPRGGLVGPGAPPAPGPHAAT